MFGYTEAEMIGRPITLIIPADRRAEEVDVLARIRAGLSIEHFETVRQRKDGSLIDISLSVSPVRTSSGAIIGASKIARDVTVQRQLARAAEEASRVKDEFLAMLSHELRTPLNAVLGYTHMLRSGQLGEDRQERAIDIIERNAKALSQLVSDVLDVSSIVTGKVRLTLEPCDLVFAIDAAVDIVRPSADIKGIALRVEGRDTRVHVRCDIDRLQQVFWNLLSNAVKYTPRGGSICRPPRKARRRGTSHRHRHRRWHPSRVVAVRVPAVLAGGGRSGPADGRTRSRPVAGASLRRASRRVYRGCERG
jgi:PAS domain S-box-containing protein